MQLRVNVLYDNPSTGNLVAFSCATNDLDYDLDHFLACLEDTEISALEDKFKICINQGGDDDTYDLDIESDVEIKNVAKLTALMYSVFTEVLSILNNKK